MCLWHEESVYLRMYPSLLKSRATMKISGRYIPLIWDSLSLQTAGWSLFVLFSFKEVSSYCWSSLRSRKTPTKVKPTCSDAPVVTFL